MTPLTDAEMDGLCKRLDGFQPKNSITREAASAIRSLRTERDALRRDAERYRWIRAEWAAIKQVTSAGAADAAIDAAMEKTDDLGNTHFGGYSEP